jgi:hypothetical protein
VLDALYPWYRENERMELRVEGERGSVPELDVWMARSADVALAGLASALTAGFDVRGKHAQRLQALIRLALDFWTWRRLDTEGLDDAGAAALMTASLEPCLS